MQRSLRAKAAEARPDRLLLLVVVGLLMIGLQMVYSASFGYALATYDDAAYLALRQAFWAIVGFALLVVLSRLDYHVWKGLGLPAMVVSVILLLAIHVPWLGVTSYGATRWLRLGPLPPIQPSEFIKLPLILYISAWLASRGGRLKEFSAGLIPFVVITGLVGGLLMLQPDLGTTILIFLTATCLFFVAGGIWRHLLILAGVATVAGTLLVLGAEYRFGRIEAFLDPWQDPQGKGFHIIQSLVAFGSGGLGGVGLGASRQKFFYVPGSHTDAIFAILGEELGFIGGIVVLALLAILVYRGFRLAFAAPDDFGVLLATGITSWLALQTIINIGGITKLIPFTGIPLPFLSYGGSALVASLAAIGILLNISKHCQPGKMISLKTALRGRSEG